ncbi:MAG: PIN domain-containing protein [Silicimonas sp.]|nr:PIN domain-containing protein [Silicimonas sp.]
MKVLIDACVLYPTLLRDLVLSTASTGVFKPLWSERILEEWQRAAARKSKEDGKIAAFEISAAKALFPDASVAVSQDTQAQLALPDRDDVHVLAAAIDGGASELLTLNIKDFPLRALGAYGITRRHPDDFLLEAFHADQTGMRTVVNSVLDRAHAHGIDVSNPRAILKRAKVPRLAKALTQV